MGLSEPLFLSMDKRKPSTYLRAYVAKQELNQSSREAEERKDYDHVGELRWVRVGR